ncbi:hypothetical protein DICVIV_06538 [Dictyocaulus viviparus]|uniref:Uncharacterized protein n=1 Tax=Dictyocaulus viviparus TaxID=29172 RepID=A0A0D8XS77_DICVI|nr:hypothetical protein DICVIV_06538 [Dictyocaulus viviparus]
MCYGMPSSSVRYGVSRKINCFQLLSSFDTLIVGIFAYKSLNVLTRTIYEPHWTTIVSFLFFLCFFVCQLIATTFIILAQRKSVAHYCYPRLVLITGLTLCSSIACIVMIFYFAGSQAAMNNFFFRIYEARFFIFCNENSTNTTSARISNDQCFRALFNEGVLPNPQTV